MMYVWSMIKPLWFLDGKFVAAASHDNMLDIYSVKRGKKCATCTGNSSYLTHFDWDKRGKIL